MRRPQPAQKFSARRAARRRPGQGQQHLPKARAPKDGGELGIDHGAGLDSTQLGRASAALRAGRDRLLGRFPCDRHRGAHEASSLAAPGRRPQPASRSGSRRSAGRARRRASVLVPPDVRRARTAATRSRRCCSRAAAKPRGDRLLRPDCGGKRGGTSTSARAATRRAGYDQVDVRAAARAAARAGRSGVFTLGPLRRAPPWRAAASCGPGPRALSALLPPGEVTASWGRPARVERGADPRASRPADDQTLPHARRLNEVAFWNARPPPPAQHAGDEDVGAAYQGGADSLRPQARGLRPLRTRGLRVLAAAGAALRKPQGASAADDRAVSSVCPDERTAGAARGNRPARSSCSRR